MESIAASGRHLYARLRASQDALLLLIAIGPALLLALAGSPGPVSVLFDLGPNDGAYLSGFDTHYEIDGPMATRWTTRQSAIDLPLQLRGPVALAYRYARMLPSSAVVDVRLGDRVVDHFSGRGGRFEERRQDLGALDPTLARIRLDVDPNDNGERGIRLDWVRVEAGAGATVRATGLARWAPLLLVAGSFVLLRLAGCPGAMALAGSLPWSIAVLVWGRLDPFAVAHVALHLWWPALLLTALGAAIARRTGTPLLAAVLLASYLLKGAGVFHPGYFYPDVQNHGRYTAIFASAPGTVAERGIAAQIGVNTAYPRFVAGKAYAFPYSPLFFVPFAWMHAATHVVEDALRQVAVLCAAAEVLAVFALARALFGPGPGLMAAILSAILPPLYSRLLLAMWPTIAGHLLDTLAIVAATRLAVQPSRARLARFGALQWAAFLTYITSLINLSAFSFFLAVLARRIRGRVLAVAAAAALATIAFLYAGFTRTFVTEIVPAILRHAPPPPGAPPAPTGGLLAQLARIPLFFGWGYPALAVAGFVLARRRADPEARRALSAYALALAALVFLRAFLPGLFKDLKEVEFASPLVAVTAGAALFGLADRGRRGAVAAVMILLGLGAFSASRYWSWWHEYRSPVMAAAAPGTGRNLLDSSAIGR